MVVAKLCSGGASPVQGKSFCKPSSWIDMSTISPKKIGVVNQHGPLRTVMAQVIPVISTEITPLKKSVYPHRNNKL